MMRTLRHLCTAVITFYCATILSVVHADQRCLPLSQKVELGSSKVSKSRAFRLELSGDGTKFVVDSFALEELTGEVKTTGLYLYDLTNQSSELLTVLPAGTALPLTEDTLSYTGIQISDDARYVVFTDPSDAGWRTIYLRDRVTQQSSIITTQGAYPTLAGSGELISYYFFESTELFSTRIDMYDIVTGAISTNVISNLVSGGASVSFLLARDGNSFQRIFKGNVIRANALDRTVVNGQEVYTEGAALSKEKRGDYLLLPKSSSGVLFKKDSKNVTSFSVRQGTTKFEPLFFSKRELGVFDISNSGDRVLVYSSNARIDSANGKFSSRYLVADLAKNRVHCIKPSAGLSVLGPYITADGTKVVMTAYSRKAGSSLLYYNLPE